ncbi:hypothetical protein D3C85_509990 [compost metagenome]
MKPVSKLTSKSTAGFEITILKVSLTIDGVLKSTIKSAAASAPTPLYIVAKVVTSLSAIFHASLTPTVAVSAPTGSPKSVAP